MTIASTKFLLAGRVLSGVAIVALAIDALSKIIAPQMMIDNAPPLGIAPDRDLYRTIGAILLVSLLLHVWPRTAFLGALLVTAFLGGAVAVNLRAGMPLFGNTLFGAYIGFIFWAGLWLRDARIRVLFHGWDRRSSANPDCCRQRGWQGYDARGVRHAHVERDGQIIERDHP